MSEHPECLLLAQLASQAVDFAKSGVPANISLMPKLHFPSKLDWSAGEILRNSASEYHESKHALGVLYQGIELLDINPAGGKRGLNEDEDIAAALEELMVGSHLEDAVPHDEITALLRPELEPYITLTLTADISENEIIPQFTSFVLELQYICANHLDASTPHRRRMLGRQRNDLQARLRQQCKALVDTTGEELSDTDGFEDWLLRAWVAWKVPRALGSAFGAKSYGYVALGSMFEALRVLKDLDEYLDRYGARRHVFKILLPYHILVYEQSPPDIPHLASQWRMPILFDFGHN
ncbi:hypothetical protein BS47DRAFT_1357042 [Hydnum rufescens UP504]|uniref:RNA-dependent RNA polymerase n=1 Tax=Hydnum rufescens UP504 TaxID=1448309 RepID=A0A9P6BBM6_9AGAM|nr:hypothetical protein BS47DRAFT_1357042 [Hydnum rufescens UP504]